MRLSDRYATRPAFAVLLALAPLLLAWTWPDVSSSPAVPSAEGKNDVAVVVGIEDYLALADVPGADDNATDWAAWLVKARGLRASRVRLLRNAEATDTAIQDAVGDGLRYLEETAKRGGAPGTFWLVFIGHGSPSPDTDRPGALLVGYDAAATAKGLLSRSVSRDALVERVEGGPQRETVVVLDACFNGRGSTGDALVTGLQLGLSTAALQTSKGRATVFTASRGNQVAGPLPGLGRPAMSYLLLGALRGWGDSNGDGHVTSGEALDYSVEALRTVVKGRSQEPEL